MTIVKPFHKVFDVDQAGASITKLVPTIIQPAGNGIIPVDSLPEPEIDDFLMLAFYCNRTAADDETATAKVTLWKQIRGLYIPFPALSLSLIFGSTAGVAAMSVTNNQFFADTITQSASLLPDPQIINPADDTIAYVKMDLFGCDSVQIQLAKGTCASLNCLASFFGTKTPS